MPPLGVGLNHPEFLQLRVFPRLTLSAAGCWEWVGCKDGFGYGRIHVCGTVYVLHRLMYQVYRGVTPTSEQCILHTCDNPACCNPTHLWLGTRADNNKDMGLKGRARNGRNGMTHCTQGHEYTVENTYVDNRGHRQCKTCNHLRYKSKKVLPTICKNGHPYTPFNSQITKNGRRVCTYCIGRHKN